jgi:hypothetical protein
LEIRLKSYSGHVCVFALTLLLAGCSDSPAPVKVADAPVIKKAPAFPTEPVTGKTALYALDKEALLWAKDRKVASLKSGEVPSMPSEAGKYPMWTAVFVSETKGQSQTLIFSVVDQPPMINKGVTVQGENSWGGQRQDALSFEISDVPVDSDAAYATAVQKSVAWTSRNPGKKPVFTLGYSSTLPAPSWYILWGSRSNGYAAFVDGKKGTLIQR